MNSELIIRTANTDDAESLLSYIMAFQKENCRTVPKLDFIPSLDQEKEWIQSRTGNRGVTIIAQYSEKVVGLIETSLNKSSEFKHNCEFGMSVLQKYRNMGIGRKLLIEFIKWTEAQELMRIELNVFSNNLPAISLYKNFGFVEDGRREKAVKLSNDNFCDLIHMFKWTHQDNSL